MNLLKKLVSKFKGQNPSSDKSKMGSSSPTNVENVKTQFEKLKVEMEKIESAERVLNRIETHCPAIMRGRTSNAQAMEIIADKLDEYQRHIEKLGTQALADLRTKQSGVDK